MSRGPSFKAGDRVVFRSNPFNRDAVARGQIKKVIFEDTTTTKTSTDPTETAAPPTIAPNTSGQAPKYVVKNVATGKESVVSVQEIVSRQ